MVVVAYLILWAGVYSADPPMATGRITLYPDSTFYFSVWKWTGNEFVNVEATGYMVITGVNYDTWSRMWTISFAVFGFGRYGSVYDSVSGTAGVKGYNRPFTPRIWYGYISLASSRPSPGWQIFFTFSPD